MENGEIASALLSDTFAYSMVKDGKLVVNTDVSKIAADGKTVEDLFREVFSYVG